MEDGHGTVLLLEGPAGGGKTSFAKALGNRLEGNCYYYSGSPDKERDLLYEIDVQGVLKRENAWVPGPAWCAFAESNKGRFAVLLIDEVDKTNPGFDAFLLRLLEDWTFRSPDGTEITADPTKIAVVLTTNGRRKLRPEVLRRCQRIHVPLPENGRLEQIVREIAKRNIPDSLLNVVIRIGDAVRKENAENAPSPKEIALCCVDLLALAESCEYDPESWRQVAASWLTKEGGPQHLDKVTSFKWARALQQEAKASITG
jgi:MoxR-like ATPase